jgi:hypothetical protein
MSDKECDCGQLLPRRGPDQCRECRSPKMSLAKTDYAENAPPLLTQLQAELARLDERMKESQELLREAQKELRLLEEENTALRRLK